MKPNASIYYEGKTLEFVLLGHSTMVTSSWLEEKAAYEAAKGA